MKRPIMLLISLVTLLLLSQIAVAQDLNIDRTKIGVAVGDTFNFMVVEDSLDLGSLGIDLSDIGDGIDLSKFGIENLGNLVATIETLVPAEGEVFSVTVKTLPGATTAGLIELAFKGESEEVEAEFYFGLPIVFTDWDGWVEILDNVTAEADALPDIEAATTSRLNDATHFQNIVVVSIPPPADLSQFSGLDLKIDFKYNKVTGVQERMEITLNLDTGTSIGNVELSLIIEQTDDSITPNDTSNTSNTDTTDESGSSVFGFELISGLLALGMVTIIYKRKKHI